MKIPRFGRIAPLAFVAGAGVCLLAVFSFRQEMLHVVPQEAVPAYTAEVWSHLDPADIMLPAGRPVPVLACIPDKTDVRIAIVVDGGVHHVAAGHYILHRRRASIVEAWTNPRATMSCGGLFRD